MYTGPEGMAVRSFELLETIQPELEPCSDRPLREKILQNRKGILLFHLCCTIKVGVFIYCCNEKRHRIMHMVMVFN